MSASDLINLFTSTIGASITRSPFAALLVGLFVLVMVLGWLAKRYIEYRNREGLP
jgi:amino acid permease